MLDISASANRTSRVHFWALLVVCFLYLVQLWTPLRLNGDSIVLLSMASSAADGNGFLDHGRKTHYPLGYPAMVVCLERVGATGSWGLVALNALFLCIGFAAAYYVARHYFQLNGNWAVTTLLFTAFSFALIKHFTLPLTDAPFFGISLVALALIVRAEKERSTLYYIFWGAALLSAIIGVLVRPVAIALFPCLAWSLSAHLGLGKILQVNKRMLIGSCVLAGALACAASILLLRTKYVQEAMSGFARDGLGRTIRNILLFRVHEAGELFLNAPASKLGSLSILVWPVGVIVAVALVMYIRHFRLGLAEVYLGAYTFIFLLWPYGDTRFWTPVLPLIFAELFSVAAPWTFTGWKRHASVVYSTLYVLMGFAALGYSTWITFSGRDFPRRYGDEHLRASYQSFYSDPMTDNSKVNESALELLRRYSGGEQQPLHSESPDRGH